MSHIHLIFERSPFFFQLLPFGSKRRRHFNFENSELAVILCRSVECTILCEGGRPNQVERSDLQPEWRRAGDPGPTTQVEGSY